MPEAGGCFFGVSCDINPGMPMRYVALQKRVGRIARAQNPLMITPYGTSMPVQSSLDSYAQTMSSSTVD